MLSVYPGGGGVPGRAGPASYVYDRAPPLPPFTGLLQAPSTADMLAAGGARPCLLLHQSSLSSSSRHRRGLERSYSDVAAPMPLLVDNGGGDDGSGVGDDGMSTTRGLTDGGPFLMDPASFGFYHPRSYKQLYSVQATRSQVGNDLFVIYYFYLLTLVMPKIVTHTKCPRGKLPPAIS